MSTLKKQIITKIKFEHPSHDYYTMTPEELGSWIVNHTKQHIEGCLLRELSPDVDAIFGQIVCCEILPKYGITDNECYTEIIGLAYQLADDIAQAQLKEALEMFDDTK